MSKHNKIQLAIGVVFLIVAVTNILRVEHYIRTTIPRDAAQEHCAVETLNLLKQRNEAIALYLKVEDDTPAIKQALVDRISAIGFPRCDFGAR
jgi:hypothetical protein